MNTFDVIIVGAGPAGSLLGYYLAKNKINVLIIDKQKLPRYKVCGGGLTRRALDIIPFNISEVIESYSHNLNITLYNSIVFEYTSTLPVIGMVMRDRFDYFLTKKATHQGAALRDETAFKSVTGKAGDLNIETSRGFLKAKILVGADGVFSKTAKALKLNISSKQMIGLEAEIYIPNANMLKTLMNITSFDFGVIPEGYGWIFPKKEHLSIGILSVSKKIKAMKQYFYNYLETKKLQNYAHIKSLKGWMIPYGPPKNIFYANEKGLLVGDAAGLSDPITGEGIFYAFKEADIASQIIADKLLFGKGGLSLYNGALKPLQKDLAYALKLHRLVYKIPRISHKLMKVHGNRLGKKYIDIITGKTTYCMMYKKIFSIQGIKTLFSNQRKNPSAS
ncbi:MAG: NAD(P)/FAD-dependent oxidoreductase [Deltaproteobacteria bacterium]|nr:NAD(P)/FAD-dependent oxidoreductase [Deltaproteobacteria bacterium]